MNKKTRSIFVLFALAAGTLATLATSPASPVNAAAAVEASGLYKITAVESDYTPIGCYGCPTMKQNVPAFTPQTTIGSSLSSATKIDTFDTTTNVWNTATKAWDYVPVSGGCAIIASGLKCWGNNSYGQLGNGDTISSTAALVTATENGSPITGVTDVSTNGLTTCIVINKILKCVGSGNWPGNYSRRTTINNDEQFLEGGSWKENKRKSTDTTQLEILNQQNTPTYTSPTVASNVWIPEVAFSTQWMTLNSLTTGEDVNTGVVKVQVGSSQTNNGASTPTICVLKTDRISACAKMTTGGDPDVVTNTQYNWDCNSDGLGYEFTTDSWSWPCSIDLIVKNTRTTVTTQKALVWSWIDAEVTGAVDIAMPSDTWGASSICFAGVATTCRTFSGGEFGVKTDPIEGGENSQAVYMTNSNYGSPGLCIYSNETMSCGAGTNGPTGPKSATKVTAVAVMAKPLNIFYGTTSEMGKLYFLLPTGILSADAWIFNCSQCGGSSSGNAVTPVSAFSTSTASAFNFVSSVTGSTDSDKYIPMKVKSGARSSSLKYRQVSIKISDTGENLAGVSIKWAAPDAVGTLTLGSSSSSDDKTDSSGLASVYLPNGPVTFTLAPPANTSNMCPPTCGTPSTVCPPTCVNGQNPSSPTTTTTTIPAPTGTLASGASLQAATITVLVADSGTIDVSVPKPPEIFTRKISVTLDNADRTPVPSATVQLKNNYLTYAYRSSGGSTSTWSSRPKDAKGFLGQMNCAYCFVAPPKYVTGVDGTVSFQSFDQGTRSGAFDAQVAYDDGVFNQAVLINFLSLTETIKLPFMASVKVSLPDADPSTPAIETDADPSTPEVDLKTDSNGGVEIKTEVKDEVGAPMGGIKQVAETVTTGCETGGLISSSTKVDTVCSEGAVSTETVTKSSIDTISKASIVRAMKVKTAAGCSAIVQATANSNGQATLVLCPTVSTKYRVRGKGALAAKTFCVRVNNTPCGAVSTSSTPTNTPTNTTPTYTYTNTYTPTAVSKVAVMKKGKVTSFTTINKTAKVSIPKGAKVVLVVAVTTKKFCSVSGTSVKALLPGSCTISVKVTPKGSKKTTTTKVKITVSQ
jgi:hypothetical protein